jgi:hypothetical protein
LRINADLERAGTPALQAGIPPAARARPRATLIRTLARWQKSAVSAKIRDS